MKATRRSIRAAFTLMEMLLVLAIISLLLGMGTYMMVGVLDGAEEGRVGGDIKALEGALIQYRTRGGLYPTESQGLMALVKKPTDGPPPKRYRATIKEAAITDPWAQPYQYRYPGTRNPDSYDLFSRGKDQKEGTEDDIGNW